MNDADVVISRINVEHVTLVSRRPFEDVEARLRGALPQVDQGIFVLLRFGEADRALAELEKAAALSIFGSRDHGGLLLVAGQHRKAISSTSATL